MPCRSTSLDLVVPEPLMQEWQVSESALARDIGSATGEEALAHRAIVAAFGDQSPPDRHH